MASLPAFRAASAAVYSANNITTPVTLTPTLPTRVRGDVLLCFGWSSANGMSVTTPSGWSALTNFASGTAVGGKVYVFSYVVDGTEGNPGVAFASLTTGTSGTPAGAAVLSFSGVDVSRGAANVLDGTPGTSDQAVAGATVAIPAITTVIRNSLVVGFALKMGELSATFTAPTNWAESLDSLTTSGIGHQSEISTIIQAAPGVLGATTCVPSVTTNARAIGLTIALKGMRQQPSPGVDSGFGI